MNFKGEAFLAWRYLKPKKTLISQLTYISLLGPILGVGVLVVITSIMNGLPRETLKKMMEFESHITLVSEISPSLQNPHKIQKDLKDVYGYESSPVSIAPIFLQFQHPTTKQNRNIPEIYAKGISLEPNNTLSELKKQMVDGQLSLEENEVIISRHIAWQNNIHVGDTIYFHSLKKYSELILDHQDENSNKEVPFEIAREMKVSGIYHLGHIEFDKRFIYVHQDVANDLLNLEWGDAQMISLTIDDGFEALNTAQKLSNDPHFPGVRFIPWQEKHQAFTDMIAKEKSMMTLVLFFIMCGAAVGVAASIFSLVLQKTKEIGVLKATGVSPLSIIVIFMSQGLFIGTVGSILGYLGGCVVLYYRQGIAQALGAWNAELHFLDKVPMYIIPEEITLICLSSILICTVASLFPALVAASVKASTALHTDN